MNDTADSVDRSAEKLFDSARPRGITYLAVLYFVGVGLAAMYVASMASSNLGDADAFPVLLVLSVVACIFGIATGVGLWTGKAWAWWLAIFYHAWFGVFSKLEKLLLLVEAMATGNKLSQGAVPIIAKLVGTLILHLLVVWYLRGAAARQFLNVERVALWKPIVASVVTGLSLAILAAAFGA